MSETVAVIIPSFGNSHYWNLLASRALASVAAQTRPPEYVFRWHSANVTADQLGSFRNSIAGHAVMADWLIFLDADDELEPTYVDAMMAEASLRPLTDILIPSVRIMTGTPDEKILLPSAMQIPARECFLDGNHIVIGAMIRRQLFVELGGFDDYPVAEDWTLWLKAWIAGARNERVPAAVYRQNWRLGGRNQLQRSDYQEICRAIQDKYGPLARAKQLI